MAEANNGDNNRDEHGRFTVGRWKPGESGNPTGRPKSKPITDACMALLSQPEELRKFIRALVDRAQDGDVAAAREIWDRIEGRVKETRELTGADGGPVEIVGLTLEQLVDLRRQNDALIEAELKLLKSA